MTNRLLDGVYISHLESSLQSDLNVIKLYRNCVTAEQAQGRLPLEVNFTSEYPVEKFKQFSIKRFIQLPQRYTCTGSAKLPHKQGKIESIMLESTVHDFQEDSPSQYFKVVQTNIRSMPNVLAEKDRDRQSNYTKPKLSAERKQNKNPLQTKTDTKI